MTPTSIVAYLTLFAAVGCLFFLASLLLGSLLRRQAPSGAKLETYECGEPAVGSTAVRFDLRFYVVALVFIIFEVEVALFFPPATIFGKATQLLNPHVAAVRAAELRSQLGMSQPSGEATPSGDAAAIAQTRTDARLLALAAMADLGLFFAVILVGFAYVWRRGDLAWVRAMGDAGDGRGRLPQREGVATLMDVSAIHQRLAKQFGPAIVGSRLNAVDPWIENVGVGHRRRLPLPPRRPGLAIQHAALHHGRGLLHRRREEGGRRRLAGAIGTGLPPLQHDPSPSPRLESHPAAMEGRRRRAPARGPQPLRRLERGGVARAGGVRPVGRVLCGPPGPTADSLARGLARPSLA